MRVNSFDFDSISAFNVYKQNKTKKLEKNKL